MLPLTTATRTRTVDRTLVKLLKESRLERAIGVQVHCCSPPLLSTDCAPRATGHSPFTSRVAAFLITNEQYVKDPRKEIHAHYFDAILPDQFDVVIHIDRTSALRPLD